MASDPQTLEEAITQLESHPVVNIVIDNGVARVAHSWQEIVQRGRQIASWLQSAPPPRHSDATVAILGSTTVATVTAVLGCVIAGRPVTLLPPVLSDRSFLSIERRLTLAGAQLLLVDPTQGPVRLSLERLGYSNIYEIGRETECHDVNRSSRPEPDDVAVIQFTSGTTGDPSLLRVSHRNIIENLSAVRDRCQFRVGEERLVSWLPLFHDMGLMGFLFQAIVTRSPLVLCDPSVFLHSPMRWAENITEYQGTLSAGPNFAYARLARALAHADQSLDLGSWRVAFNGGEQIRPDICAAFAQEAQRFGFRPGSICPAYGLAEATLAVTLPQPGNGVAIDVVSGSALRMGIATPCGDSAADAQTLCMVGSALGGINVTIVGPNDRAAMPDRAIGEVIVTGPSVVGDVVSSSPRNAESCSTGDLGYLHDHQLVICGRLKEAINVAGHTILPTEIELVVERLPGARPGRVIAVSMHGPYTDEIAVIAEGELSPTSVRTAVREAIGITPRVVKIVDAGVIPRTTSGKLQRSLCREQLIGGAFD